MVKPQRGKRPKGGYQQKPRNKPPVFRKDDIYEAADSDPDEEKNKAQRYDRVDNYEYELPSDFVDEEIEEDEAFNSEDERRYGHLFGKAGGASSEDDFDDDEEEEEEGSEEDLLDSDEDEEEDESGSEDGQLDSELEDAFAQAGAAGGGDLSDLSDEEDEEEAQEGNEAARQAMVQALTGGAAEEKHRRRRRDVVVTEAYPESEFNLPAAGPEGELTLTDLISGLGDGRAKLGSARKTLEKLEKRTAPVPAPLPGPIRDRQERKAGYEAAKKDIAKWMPLVKAHREAPTLHFKSDASAVPRTVTTASLAAKHTPETAMEAEVAALLEAAGAQTAAAVAEAEDALAMKALTVAEAKERRDKLAKMRALLFYHEVKSKRLKKIKSKEYRKRLKKAEKRKAADGGADELLLNEDELRQAQEDAEFDRAQERLTLKHRNTSRFIRRALKRGGTNPLDDGTKQAVAEQLRLGEELRQKVHRMKSGARGGSDTDASDEEERSSDDDSSGRDSDREGRRQLSSKAKTAALEILEGHGAPKSVEMPKEGLFALPFMQRAMERRKAEAAEEARALLELDGADGGYSGGYEQRDQHGNGAARGGRMKFTGGGEADRVAQRVRQLEAAALASDSDADGDEREDAEAKAERLSKRLRGEDAEEIDLENGGGSVLQQVTRQQKKIARQDRLFGVAAADSAPEKTSSEKHASGRGIIVSVGPASGGRKESNREQAGGAAAEEEEVPSFFSSKKFKGGKPGYVFKKGPRGVGYYMDTAPAGGKAGAGSGKKPAGAAGKQQHNRGKGSTAAGAIQASTDSDDEGNMKLANGGNHPFGGGGGGGRDRKKDPLGLSQEDLVRRAFAGDDVIAQFASEKAAEVETELPSDDVPGALPGWGTWAGAKREPRWAVEAKAKAVARREAAASGRKDAGLQYVVISEKWDKKNAKYRTPDVPFPFDSRETYERAMRQPLGKDFNTDAGFRNLTRPAVVKDAGVIIQPVRFSEAMAGYARRQQQGEAERGAKRHAVLTVEGGMPKKAKLEKNRGGQKGKKTA